MQLSRFMLRKVDMTRTKDKMISGLCPSAIISSTLRKDLGIKGCVEALGSRYKGEVHQQHSLFFIFYFQQVITNNNHYTLAFERNSLLEQKCQTSAPGQAIRLKAKKYTMHKLFSGLMSSLLKIGPTSS
jgi:hypothetical protein